MPADETSWKEIGIWSLAVVLSVTFMVSGLGKIGGSPMQVASFERWDFPAWFAYVVGVVELVGGVALLNRTGSPFAASLLAGTMLGAIFTHVLYGELAMVVVPGALLAALVTLGWARRPAYLRRRAVLTMSKQGV